VAGVKHGEMKAIHRVLDPDAPPETSPACCALAIMTKAPRAGEVKTRLVPPLTKEEAAELNTCFLRDIAKAIFIAILDAGKCGRKGRGVGVYTPVNAEKIYADIFPVEFDLIPQRGKDFGERLYFAAEDLFRYGFSSLCLINSDSPTVQPRVFAQALEFLHLPGDRVVLGPADDGGYYLIGLKTPHREIFDRIDWSTDRVFDQTMKRAGEIGVEVKLLPSSYDVDDPAMLRRLCGELLVGNASRNRAIARNTRKFLSGIVECEGRGRIWAT
jgi:uncharacterized protein